MFSDTGLLSIFQVYRGVRVLVTGSTGFVGRWVTYALVRAGADVYAVTRDLTALDAVSSLLGFQVKSIIADLQLAGAFTDLFNRLRPAIVFNIAGYGVDPAERDEIIMRRMNCALSAEMAQAVGRVPGDSRWTGMQIISTGSAFEYGIQKGPIDETSETKPTDAYGQTKLEGTRCLQEARLKFNLRAATARLATVYGPGEHSARLLPSLLRAAKRREPIDFTAGLQERDFTYVEDIAEGLLRLGMLQDIPEGIVNLATGRLATVRFFTESARDVLNIPQELLRIGAIPYRGNEVWQGPLNIGRLESLLGWRPQTEIRKGIAATRDFTLATAAREYDG